MRDQDVRRPLESESEDRSRQRPEHNASALDIQIETRPAPTTEFPSALPPAKAPATSRVSLSFRRSHAQCRHHRNAPAESQTASTPAVLRERAPWFEFRE